MMEPVCQVCGHLKPEWRVSRAEDGLTFNGWELCQDCVTKLRVTTIDVAEVATPEPIRRAVEDWWVKHDLTHPWDEEEANEIRLSAADEGGWWADHASPGTRAMTREELEAEIGPTMAEAVWRARWLLGNATAGFHGGTSVVVINNWVVEAYELLCEMLDGVEEGRVRRAALATEPPGSSAPLSAEHGADIYHEEGGGVLPTCHCGWEGTVVPTFDEAAESYARHRLQAAGQGDADAE